MLNNLTTKKDIRTFSVSPENLTGEKGKGGMAIEGTAASCARDLGQGWKVNPYLHLDAGKTVVGTSLFSNPSAIEKLEYNAGGTWFDMAHDGDGKFGPAGGFPMSDATSTFRVTFKTAGDYSFTVKMEELGGTALCETTADFSVREYKKAELTTTIDGQTLIVGVPFEFEFEARANDDAGKTVVGTSLFSDSSAIEKLEYYTGGTWFDMAHDGHGKFGPATGFPMTDATSTFRVTFKTSGDYAFTVKMEELDGTVLCATNANFTVVPETHEHSFCEWYTTKDATCCDAGREARICACGESEGRLSPATGHHFDINGVCAGCGFTKTAIAAANAAPSRTNPNTGVHF
jgi:hypothetical protein